MTTRLHTTLHVADHILGTARIKVGCSWRPGFSLFILASSMLSIRRALKIPARCFSSTMSVPEPKVYEKTVSFRAENGKIVELNAVYEDSLSTGSSVGTVVAFHGSPGSHNDFKYIRSKLDQFGVRFIGVNYPGFKQTQSYPGQQHVNEERQSYSNALLKAIQIEDAEKLIIMAHSRGCENALMTATTFKADGLVMMNPIGLRKHKSIRPISRLQRIETAYDLLPKFLGDAMIYKMYHSFGIKVKDGEEAISALRSVIRCGLEKTLPFIHKLNEQETKTFIIFAGKDIIVEEEIIFEALKEYKGLQHFDYDSDIPSEDVPKILDTFDSGRGTSVFVAKDKHYQNKHRAELVAEATLKILGVATSSSSSSSSSSTSLKNKI